MRAADPLVQYFIYLISGLFRDANGNQFFAVKQAFDLSASQVLEFEHGTVGNVHYFTYFEYLCGIIFSPPFANLIISLLRRTCWLTRNFSLLNRCFARLPTHLLSGRQDVGVAHVGRCHSCGGMNRSIVPLDKLGRTSIYLYVFL